MLAALLENASNWSLCFHPCSLNDRPSGLKAPFPKKDRSCFSSLQSSPMPFIIPRTIWSPYLEYFLSLYHKTVSLMPVILSHWAPATPNQLPIPRGHWEHSLLRAAALSFLSEMLLLQIFQCLCPSFPSGVCPDVSVSEKPFLTTLYAVTYSPTQIRFYSQLCFSLLHNIYLIVCLH